MLRTTISRIRKVCSVAFIPRILRGDQCSAAVSSAVIRKAHKSTKSAEDDKKAVPEKNNNVPNYTFSSERRTAELKIDETFRTNIGKGTGQIARIANENNQPTLLPRLPLTHRERCQRLIDQAHGKANHTQSDRDMGEQYFSHNVNLEDTRRAILESEKAKLKLQEQKINIVNPVLPDDRAQYSIFKMSRELNFKDDTRDDIIITDSCSAREPDLGKNLENIKGTAEETPLVEEPNLSQAKEDFDKCVNNPEGIEKKALCLDDAETIEVVKDERKPDLYQKATPCHTPHMPWFLNATTAREGKVTFGKGNVYESVDNRESIERKALCDDDAGTIKLAKDERKHDLHQDTTPNDKPYISQGLNATTATERKFIFAKDDVNEFVNNQESVEKKALCDDAQTIKLVKDERKLDLHQDATPKDEPHVSQVLRATTARKHTLFLAKDHDYEDDYNQESVEKKAVCDDAQTIELVKDVRKHDLHQDATPKDEPHISKFLHATTTRKHTLFLAKDDDCEDDYNQESVEKKAVCDDAQTIKLVKDERKHDLHQDATPKNEPHISKFLHATSTRKHTIFLAKDDDYEDDYKHKSVEKKALCDDALTIKLVKDERKHVLHQDATPKDDPHIPQFLQARKHIFLAKDDDYEDDYKHSATNNRKSEVLNATTAKVEEEKLTQKMEIIEETPIVEAQKPNNEGFNVTPKVLGNEPTLNCKTKRNIERFNVTPKVLENKPTLEYKTIENNQDNSSKAKLPGALDEVSKRCLKCPIGQIDEMLINEMEKLGMTSRTAQKAPSTPLEDDLVRMDVSNKLLHSTIEKQDIRSESPEQAKKENVRAFDFMTTDVKEQNEDFRKYQEIVKLTEEGAHDILYPDHIRVQLKPLACKPQEYSPADDYNSTTKLPSDYLSPTHHAAKINKQGKEKTLLNSRASINKQNKKQFSSDKLLDKIPQSEAPKSHAFINYQKAQLRDQSIDGNVLRETAQYAQTVSIAAEAEKTAAENINTNVTSVDPLNDTSDNMKRDRFLKPESSTYFKGDNKPSCYATINASKSVGDENQTPAEHELYKNSFHSRNFAAKNVWGHYQNGTASKYRNVSTTEEQEWFEEQGQTSANKIYAKVPNTNFSLPGEKCNKEMADLCTDDKLTQQCSSKLYSTEKSEPKPEVESENVSLPEEILKQHRLDPYYVLTCNETCPISPVTASTIHNSDFVDTTETLYMKKNICESVRPKPQPIARCATKSSAIQAHPNDVKLGAEPKTMSDTKFTSIPDAIGSMPKLGEPMTLTELLRRTRERNRLAYIVAKSGLDVQAAGKSTSKSPRCLPPRSPQSDPIPPPTFGLPKLKRRPPVCKPKKKPSNKCCCAMYEENSPEMPYELNEADVCAIRSKVNLTEEVIYGLQNLGMILGRVLRRSKSNVETLLTRDYEPWTPIPSWKIPPKTEKKQWRPAAPCVKGCSIFPKARASMRRDPPCDQHPCSGFPKRRSFSMLDCFTVSLGENKVYDLGDF